MLYRVMPFAVVKTFLYASLLAAPIYAADISGHWALAGNVAGVSFTAECELKQDGAKMAGTCVSGDKQNWKLSGEVTESKIKFTHDTVYEGSNYTLNYTGTMQGDADIKGDIEVAGNAGDFTMKKSTATASAGSGAAAGSANLSGTWKVATSIEGHDNTLTCLMNQASEALTGNCKLGGKEYKVAGNYLNGHATWKHAAEYNGDALTLLYDGSVDSPTKMTGKVAVDPMGVSGTFTATKE